jgi:trehalose 6-phosphate synthase/phosphatase
MGDDWTDEECFRALPPEAIAIGVGYRTTIAAYRVATPRAARALLATIVSP